MFMMAGVMLVTIATSWFCTFRGAAEAAAATTIGALDGFAGWGGTFGSGLDFAETLEVAAVGMGGLFRDLPLEASHPASFALKKTEPPIKNIDDMKF